MGVKMNLIQTAIQFIKDNWAEIVAIITAAYAVFVKAQTLFYKFRYGSVKKMYQQIKTFKDDTSGLVKELKQANTYLQATSKLTYELARNANIAKEAKLKMNAIVKTITNDVEDVIDEKPPEEATVQKTVENNNKSISEILGSL